MKKRLNIEENMELSKQDLAPVCMFCKNVRMEGDNWISWVSESDSKLYSQLTDEKYLSHGLCNPCFAENYGELY